MKYLILILLLGASSTLVAQRHTPVIEVDSNKRGATIARPVGGTHEFNNQIAANLRYPSAAKAEGKEGAVFVQFAVKEDGSLSNVEVVPGRERGYGMDEEAIRVVKLTKWEPAREDNKPIASIRTAVIHFSLNNGQEAGLPQE